MNTMELLLTRQSLRSYDDKPIQDDVKRAVLEAMVRGPSAGALTLYSVLEVQDQTIKDQLAESCDHQPFIAKAPWVLIFLADYQRMVDGWESLGLQRNRNPGMGDMLLAVDDALIAAQNAVVAAEAQGLGSCYIGDIMENIETHVQLLNLPKYVFPAAMLCIGYPKPGASRSMVPRLPIEDLLHQDGYQQRPVSSDAFAEKQLKRGLEKFNMGFSSEMERSVQAWMKRWMDQQ
ncbi:nitroreductase family protein [Eubacteriales bacterium OttesenSCG-928-N13]|nr:nitroreductase family protein [Eubacteriales bacterium OttesenSCG-928-N13]